MRRYLCAAAVVVAVAAGVVAVGGVADAAPTCDPGYVPMDVGSDPDDPVATRYRSSVLLCLLDRGPGAAPRFQTQVVNDSPLVWVVNNAPAWSPAATAEERADVQAFRWATEGNHGSTLLIEPDHTAYFRSNPGDPWPWLAVDLGMQGTWEIATRGVRTLEKKAPGWAASMVKNRSLGAYAVVKCALAGADVARKLPDTAPTAPSGYVAPLYSGVRGAGTCLSAIQYANERERAVPPARLMQAEDLAVEEVANPQLLKRAEAALADNVKATLLQRVGRTAGRLLVGWHPR